LLGEEAEMSPRFAYTYFMRHDPDRVRAAAPAHAAYWQRLRLPGYLGGPFADRSGGLILFETHEDSLARRFVDEDPFVREDLVERTTLKEWRPE
jgi:uncharacterized protein YciI